MKGMEYFDPLYGKVELPDIFRELINQSELLRLQSVGLMNFRSLQKLSLTSISRLEHSIGTAILLHNMAKQNSYIRSRYEDYVCAALYHDINCASFGHAVEWAVARYKSFDHVIQSEWISDNRSSIKVNKPLSESSSPSGFLTKSILQRFNIEPAMVSSIISGNDSCVISSKTMDLDNIDNVSRMALYLGLDFDKTLPIKLSYALRLSECRKLFEINNNESHLIQQWLELRTKVYTTFIYSADYISYEYMIFSLIRELYLAGGELVLSNVKNMTDNELLFYSSELEGRYSLAADIAKKIRVYDIPECVCILSTTDLTAMKLKDNQTVLMDFLREVYVQLQKYNISVKGNEIDLHITTDDRKTNRKITYTSGGNIVDIGEDLRKVVFGIVINDKAMRSVSDVIVQSFFNVAKNNFDNVKIDKNFMQEAGLSLFDE